MKKKRLTSDEIIRETLGESPAFFTIGLNPEMVYRYEDNQRTDEVVAIRLPISIIGTSYDTVKLPSNALRSFTKQDYMFKRVEFKNLEANEFNNNIYFKADGVSVVKEA